MYKLLYVYIYIFYLNWCDAYITLSAKRVKIEASITVNMIDALCWIPLMKKFLVVDHFGLSHPHPNFTDLSVNLQSCLTQKMALKYFKGDLLQFGAVEEAKTQ